MDPRVASENFTAEWLAAIASITGRLVAPFARYREEQEIAMLPGTLLLLAGSVRPGMCSWLVSRPRWQSWAVCAVVANLHAQWDGVGSESHAAVHKQWKEGADLMRAALAQLGSAGQHAHTCYSGAVEANLKIWG